jgi:ribosomal protein S18 acetylase RimI-like enzyme
MIDIRKAIPKDCEAVWNIIHEVIKEGNTYVFSPESTREEMIGYWFAEDKHTYVALINNQIVGTFLIKHNHPGLGSHVANASYMTSKKARRQGIGETMALFSLEESRRLGYVSMQFNIVVKTNLSAVRLWQKLGFNIIGEIPEAFNHQIYGLINAYIMYRKL